MTYLDAKYRYFFFFFLNLFNEANFHLKVINQTASPNNIYIFSAALLIIFNHRSSSVCFPSSLDCRFVFSPVLIKSSVCRYIFHSFLMAIRVDLICFIVYHLHLLFLFHSFLFFCFTIKQTKTNLSQCSIITDAESYLYDESKSIRQPINRLFIKSLSHPLISIFYLFIFYFFKINLFTFTF